VVTAEKFKKEQEQLLVEGCRTMTKGNLSITKEFESIENLDNTHFHSAVNFLYVG